MEQWSALPDGAGATWARGGSAGPDDVEFAALVPLHMATMLLVAGALVGLADAEDAAQEAVLRAWQARHALRNQSSARSWLLSITVNLCRDWLRGRHGTRQLRERVLPDGRDSGLALIGADPGASDAAAALDLRRAINALDEDQRVVVALRYYAGMDSGEIGALLGVPAATIRTRLRRALAALRDEPRGPGYPSLLGRPGWRDEGGR